MNEIILSGRLVAAPEVKSVDFGEDTTGNICKFRLAVNRAYKKRDGSVPTDFFFCEVNQRTSAGKFVDQYCGKGDLVAVIGSVENFSYTDDAGTERTGSVVRVRNVELLAHPRPKQDGEMANDLDPEQEAIYPELGENPFD